MKTPTKLRAIPLRTFSRDSSISTFEHRKYPQVPSPEARDCLQVIDRKTDSEFILQISYYGESLKKIKAKLFRRIKLSINETWYKKYSSSSSGSIREGQSNVWQNFQRESSKETLEKRHEEKVFPDRERLRRTLKLDLSAAVSLEAFLFDLSAFSLTATSSTGSSCRGNLALFRAKLSRVA